ncbi:PAS domain-containing protein [Wohlfahrtiimonas chitiniclastica]|uniref:PAS domain-containing protein n=1 Tax=Wohlfahrtiimonas TaxID=582472 RepID=UPI0009D968D7|nr:MULTISPECIES: PAS domain-containing protein [Wohlfahrtiimonas]MBS7820952.1 PAS domain-containing protein [Wohlfahrtiimonas chitiniclastica]MBS7828099.1 PAS domain-containing protein [Wohlfahrtiimonas chitiniclastica]OYQ73769.1 PAS sensor domain-containing protein [Wohlfahrtiimonas sp. G9077]OYQ75848.1 PAS sensor domain-containing protein [Wohlfahrtiimonas chitiniclastica]OYQ87384.1 PAS sensor domain-containing protein [Wohlfahrtiimonas chitiniclastica]
MSNSREVELHYYDGSTRTVSVNDTRIPYPIGRLIVSYTDTNGIIMQANQAFIDISGYTRDELIGQPQNILRHPDMPKAAFKDMWSTIESGKSWNGYVKNLCKDGEYYWVYATVVPSFDKDGNITAFTSIRRMPSEEKLKDAIALYATLD